MVAKLTDSMQIALRYINSTARHIFLTGKAGTGKTTFLRNLSLYTHKQFAVVAPTGIAALNAGGTTIHSQFLFPFGMFIPDRNYNQPPEGANYYTESVLAKRHPMNSQRRQVLRAIDLLVIDEVSMLRADLLDAIDYRLRSVRGNRQSFGGVQLLLIGDLYQLPPVIKREEESRLASYYKNLWFFQSHALQRDGFCYIELNEIFRQSDNDFIRILNNLRVNRPTPEDFEVLNKYYYPQEQIKNMREVITLTTHNYRADEMNQRALAELPGPSHFFEAKITDFFPESIYPVLQKLELKVGAQIMFTRNDSEGSAYYNGKLATVRSIDDDVIVVTMAGSGDDYVLRRSTWENKKYQVNDESKELEEEVVGAFEQYPVKLAWAITVHKSQGLTFDKAIIDVAEAFADGQVYVALSRLRSIDGLILRTRIDPSTVSTDKLIVNFDIENNVPDRLTADMRERQTEFVHHLVNRAFDFNSLTRQTGRILSGDEDTPALEDENVPELRQLHEAMTQEQQNTLRFREQLKNLLEAGQFNDFAMRLSKGSDYYQSKLWHHLNLILRHIEETKLRSRVKEYLAELTDVDQLLFKKLEEIDKVSVISQTILSGHDSFDFTKSREERMAKRNQMLSEIVKEISSMPAKGKKKKKSRTKAKVGLTTFEETYKLLNEGKTIDQIAEERGLVRGTIESHLAKGVETGVVSVLQFVAPNDLDTIVTALKVMPEGFSSADLYGMLRGKFSYGILRAVMHHAGIVSTKKKKE